MKCAKIPSSQLRYPSGSNSGGSALVIILSALVLVCIIVLLFMSRSLLNRQISYTSAGQYRAENLGITAIDTIVGDLKSEIAAGSTKTVDNGIAIFQPTNNFTAVPKRVGDDGYANVVKRSAGGMAFWNGNGYSSSIPTPIRAVSGNSTTNASANGRFIKAAKWNDPYLLGTNLATDFAPPDWIIVTRNGAITNATQMPPIAELSDPAVLNRNFAIGRFAYMIYNEGGLLDINVAGFPSNANDDFKRKRGLLPQVDLGRIPGILDAASFVAWRNAASSLDYANHTFGSTNGFLSVKSGDQALISRQDLIKYAQTHPEQMTLSALQYLATFTRELNAPSYSPPLTRPLIVSGYPNHGKDEQFNPAITGVRVTKEFTRMDGTDAKIGEPLVKHRFPLSRLGLLTSTATASVNDPIYKYFGLTRSTPNDPWSYRQGANRILNLSEVAEEKREPDFFELLQAGIAVGSLGMSAGDWNSSIKNQDENVYYQIVQIGANLIDQYDSDSWPAHISYDGKIFSGIENLPYLTRILEQPYGNTGSGTYAEKVGAWYRPEIWNPHAEQQSSSLPLDGPTELRYIVQGSAFVKIFDVVGNPGVYVVHGVSDINDFSATTGMTFANSPSFRVPTIVTGSASGHDAMIEGGFNGIWIGDVETANTTSTVRSLIEPSVPVSHLLQYKRNGTWITYDAIRNVTGGAASIGTPGFTNVAEPPYSIRSDPRTDRFGTVVSADPITSNNTVRSGGAAGTIVWGLTEPAPIGWVYGTTYYTLPALYPGLLSENKTTSITHYADPDGVVRKADGAYAGPDSVPFVSYGGLPLGTDIQYSRPKSRPYILNRPFRSIADMGYASRGMPWKHLDFFTSESGDVALLDLFCLTESPPDGIVAGRLDLNTKQSKILEVALADVIRREEPSGSSGETADTPNSAFLSDAQAATLATSLVDLTSDTNKGPLLNRSQLVTRWVGDPNVVPVTTSDPQNTRIKRRREAPVRALSEIGNTRTWNLLIDIIVQSGKYPPAAQDLNQFSVEGERRYWLHVAIDRYTGKVIDQFLEPVME